MLDIEDDNLFESHSLKMTFFQLLNYAGRTKLDSAIFEKLRGAPYATLVRGAVQVLRSIADGWTSGANSIADGWNGVVKPECSVM